MGVSWLLLKKSDKKSRGRLTLTAAAIAVGVMLVLSYAAGLNAMIQRQNRSLWRIASVEAMKPIKGEAPTYMAVATNSNLNQWNDEEIYVTSLRPISSNSPTVPGLKTPVAGQYYVSPALQKLMKANPTLSQRFSGKMIGIIPDSLLASPDMLAVIRGMSQAEQAKLGSQVEPIYKFYLADDPDYKMQISTMQKVLLIVGSITLLFPIILLISVATQLGSKQRERRYAALRLVGATRRQVRNSVTLESVIVAAAGTAGGTAVFWLIRPALAQFKLENYRFFLSDLSVSGSLYAAVIAITLMLVLIASWWGLRHVQLSPLGVVKENRTQKPPHWWSVLPLVAGLGLLIYIGTLDKSWSNGSYAKANLFLLIVMAALLLVLLGLILAGSWLTRQAARLVAHFTRRPVTLLATKRMSLLSRQTFRAVGGVVVALLIGSFYLSFVGGVNHYSGQQLNKNGYSMLRPEAILVMGSPAANFSKTLQDIDGVQKVRSLRAPTDNSNKLAIACPDLPRFTKLQCLSGSADKYALVSFDGKAIDKLTSDNLVVASSVSSTPVGYVVQGASALEQIRTAVATASSADNIVTTNSYVVSGENAQKPVINPVISELAQLAYVVIGLTLFVAIASLIVSTVGGLLERQRSFYTLRLGGMSLPQLRRVMVIESLIPLLLVSVIASALGVWTAAIFLRPFSSVSVALPPLFYIIVGVALLATITSIVLISHQLDGLTTPENNQAE